LKGIVSVKCASQTGIHGIRPPPSCDFALARTDGDYGSIAVLAGFNPVLSRLQDGKCPIRSVYFKNFVAVHPTHTDVERPLGELNLNGSVIQVQEGKTRVVAQANRR
jgi:hypothetical protein